MIPPQPVPQTVGVQLVDFEDGRRSIMVTLNSVNGTWVLFLEPDAADEVAAQLATAARQTRLSGPGLIVPPGTRAAQNGHEPPIVPPISLN